MHLSIKMGPNKMATWTLITTSDQPASDAELSAIFIRSGSTQHSAVELARLLLQHFGSLNFDAELPEFSQFHGIGPTKYSQLMAVKRIGTTSVVSSSSNKS